MVKFVSTIKTGLQNIAAIYPDKRPDPLSVGDALTSSAHSYTGSKQCELDTHADSLKFRGRNLHCELKAMPAVHTWIRLPVDFCLRKIRYTFFSFSRCSGYVIFTYFYLWVLMKIVTDA